VVPISPRIDAIDARYSIFVHQFSNLDAKGSNPSSLSIESGTYGVITDCDSRENGVTVLLGRLEMVAFPGLAPI
jgi:hypothetical protein